MRFRHRFCATCFAFAALLAAAILGSKHADIREALRKFRVEQTDRVMAQPDPSVSAVAIPFKDEKKGKRR